MNKQIQSKESGVPEPDIQMLEVNGLTMKVTSMGSGPLVVMCHGFPELAISWRSQISALAAAGHRTVALDMRRYGGTTAPSEVSDYTMLHLVGDMVEPETRPDWLSKRDIEEYAGEFTRTGFLGGA